MLRHLVRRHRSVPGPGPHATVAPQRRPPGPV